MWEPFAKALGYPKKKIGFDQLTKLAVSNQGFAAFGKPEFGKFKLVHTNPDFSTSGLSAVVAEYYAATGKKEGLTEQDVTASAAAQAGARHRALDRPLRRHHAVHRRPDAREGPGYASAVAMEEVTLLDFNRNRGSQPPLVALYPPEGTFYSDNPFITIDADYNTRAERDGAKAFQEFLAEEIDAEAAGRFGFRPADLKAKPAGRVTQGERGRPAQPERVLGLPEPRVLDRIRNTWREDRKPANVLLVVDVSGSMNEQNRLARAKEGLKGFLREVSPNDRLGLMIFSDRVQPLIPIGERRAELAPLVDRLIADGGTAVYNATAQGIEIVKNLRDKERINAVVVLTDGEDTDSSLTADEVVRRAGAQGDSSDKVRVFTIAYSAGAAGAADALKRISRASGGQEYTGDTDDIEAVYRSISSFFSAPRSNGRKAPLLALGLQPGAHPQRPARSVRDRAAGGGRGRGHPAGGPGDPAAGRPGALRRGGRAHVLRRGRGQPGARARAGQAARGAGVGREADRPRHAGAADRRAAPRRAPAGVADPRGRGGRRASVHGGARRGGRLRAHDGGHRAARPAALRRAGGEPARGGGGAPRASSMPATRPRRS